MTFLNLGIVAHVDAGKTSLTERLLFETGVLDRPGSVDAGTTRTDSLNLERRRGITIRAAVTSFPVGGVLVNLIDTPGHPDFIAEVERSLTVLDAAVLVVSAVEGVQSQTVVIWRALRRIGIPTILFINKIDRMGAQTARVIGQIRERLTDDLVVLTETGHEGTRAATVHPYAVPTRPSGTAVACGSAITGAGVRDLADVLPAYVPAHVGSAEQALAATVFAIDRVRGQRRSWIRLWDGRIRVRDRLTFDGREAAKITGLWTSGPGGLERATSAGPGQIAAVTGPPARIGDEIGAGPERAAYAFPPATTHAAIEPVEATERGRLWTALTELADEDPLIGLHLDEHLGEAAIEVRGEVQQEVVAALVAERYGVATRFTQTGVVCIERVLGNAWAVERIKERGNPYLAAIGLRVEPLPVGAGVVFDPGIERGRLVPAFIAATEEGVRSALRQGLRGWEVTDLRVTMTESAYFPRQSAMHAKFDKKVSSVAADFRNLAPVVLFAALERARTRVCQPVERFDLEVPHEVFPAIASLLGRAGAAIDHSEPVARYLRLSGTVPTEAVRDLSARLPDLTGGAAVLVTRLDHYAPVESGSPPPIRTRVGLDPRNRTVWFRDVPR